MGYIQLKFLEIFVDFIKQLYYTCIIVLDNGLNIHYVVIYDWWELIYSTK